MTDFESYHDVRYVHGPAGPQDSRAVEHGLLITTSTHQVFEFYIPVALLAFPETDDFLEQVRSYEAGSTDYRGEGIWEGESENVKIVRVSIEIADGTGQVRRVADNVRSGFRDAVRQLMTNLVSRQGHVEQAVFFNDWTTAGTLVKRIEPPHRV